MIGIYIVGLIASFVYTRIMAHVTRGFLYHVRNDMFNKMQSLPIKFFDTHTHGDIMSIYTNDTDAIRQLISQSIPQAYASLVAVITLLVTMLVSSIWLTLVVLCRRRRNGNGHKTHRRKERKILYASTGRDRQDGRIYRRDDARTKGGQGVLSRRAI